MIDQLTRQSCHSILDEGRIRVIRPFDSLLYATATPVPNQRHLHSTLLNYHRNQTQNLFECFSFSFYQKITFVFQNQLKNDE